MTGSSIDNACSSIPLPSQYKCRNLIAKEDNRPLTHQIGREKKGHARKNFG